MPSIHEQLRELLTQLTHEFNESKTHLISMIERYQTKSEHTTRAFECLQRAESAMLAMGFVTKEWMSSDEFAAMSHDEVVALIQAKITSIESHEVRMFRRGINTSDTIDASGMLQVKVSLKKLLQQL